MIIKPSGLMNNSINQFHLLGKDEKALAKAFAFTLSKSPELLFKILRFLGITSKHTENNFRKIEIITEKYITQGRIDIDIILEDSFHVIIETKVGSNKIYKQRTQYIKSFSGQPQQVLCFITQVNDYKIQRYKNIIVKNIGWIEIDSLIDDDSLLKNKMVKDFQTFLRRGYNLKDLKEILVQDVGNKKEIKKYLEHNVYRRDVVSGSPLYFSPYFTRIAVKEKIVKEEGISSISRILGIITCKPKDLMEYRDDLMEFASTNEDLVEKWLAGVKLDNEDKNFTYFFLDESTSLPKPLLKDTGIAEGRGVNWIAAQIPKNRCVTFEEFIKRIKLSLK